MTMWLDSKIAWVEAYAINGRIRYRARVTGLVGLLLWIAERLRRAVR